jgi:hypothetical protein
VQHPCDATRRERDNNSKCLTSSAEGGGRRLLDSESSYRPTHLQRLSSVNAAAKIFNAAAKHTQNHPPIPNPTPAVFAHTSNILHVALCGNSVRELLAHLACGWGDDDREGFVQRHHRRDRELVLAFVGVQLKGEAPVVFVDLALVDRVECASFL